MRIILCEKQFLYLNANVDADANAEMSMKRFPNGQQELLHNFFLCVIQN